jgi:MAPEG family
MASLLLASATLAFGGSFLEAKFGPTPNADGPLGLSTYAGLTPLIFTYMCWWSVSYGFLVVGNSRRKAIEQAKKDGEQDVDERYGLPNLYAQGTSKHARTYNCIQRSHQHVLETFTQALVTSLFASYHYPLTAALNAVLYAIGRQAMSKGYASGQGDAAKRYSSRLATLCWRGLFANIFLAGLSCLNMVAGKKLLW